MMSLFSRLIALKEFADSTHVITVSETLLSQSETITSQVLEAQHAIQSHRGEKAEKKENNLFSF